MLNQLRTRIVPLAGVLLLTGGVASTLGGCQLFRETRAAEPGPSYPIDLPRGTVAPVQVFREVTKLRMTNTTARTFGPGRLWLNQEHSLEVGVFEPGDTWELDLRGFVDEFGDLYRAGGFFAQRDPAAVVLVEIETGPADNRELVGFVVVENRFN